MTPLRALPPCLFLMWVGVVSPSRAESKDELLQRGIQLRREQRDVEALEAFRQAYALEPAPRTQAQIALAEEALGQWVPAEHDLSEALKAVDDLWIRGHLDLLRGSLDGIRHHLGTLAIDSNVAGAELWVNGALIGALPLAPLRVPAGSVDVELRSAKHEPIRRKADVPPNAEVHLTIEVVETGAPVVAASPGDAGGASEPIPPAAGPQASLAPSGSAPPASGDSSSMRRTVAWGMVGGGAVLLTTAIAAQIVREQSTAIYNDDARCMKPGTTRDEVCGVYRGRADVANAFAIAGYIGAGALGIGAALLFLTGGKRPPAVARLYIEPTLNGLGAGYSGRF